MAFLLSELTLKSNDFKHMKKIPKGHTGEGSNVSPHLSWDNVPEDTKAFALIAYDPDAPLIKNGEVGFVHWLLYNIPGDVRELKKGSAPYTQGDNDGNQRDYVGPMPPKGDGPHLYYFMLIALDKDSKLQEGLTMQALLKHIEPHALGMTRLVGKYER